MQTWSTGKRPMPPTSPLSISITAATGQRYVALLRKKLTLAHAILRAPLREFSLALVGDTRMSRLHQRFLGIAGPTDVLTFPLEYDARGRTVAGEVVVCVPQAVRCASRSKGLAIDPVAAEILLYALHGMLHLCDFDDRTADGFAMMHRAEDRLLRRLGIGSVFDPGARR